MIALYLLFSLQSLKYPPWKSTMELLYDGQQRRARLQVFSGLNEGKTYYRLFDRKKEYMITGGSMPDCVREYLAEKMPVPKLPDGLAQLDSSQDLDIDGVSCSAWEVSLEDGLEIVRVWADKQSGVVLRLTDFGEVDATGTMGPLMTYTLSNVRLFPDAGSSDAETADASAPGGGLAPARFDLPDPWTHNTCDRQVGGQPWLHLLHHYLMI